MKTIILADDEPYTRSMLKIMIEKEFGDDVLIIEASGGGFSN